MEKMELSLFSWDKFFLLKIVFAGAIQLNITRRFIHGAIFYNGSLPDFSFLFSR